MVLTEQRDTLPAALDGLRVLDLSGGVAGQYCAKLLASFGASTVLIEPPEGAFTRTMGPTLSSGELSTRSTMFRHLNQGKTSVVADMSTREGKERVSFFAKRADVVIRDDTTILDFDLDPSTIECVIGEFPNVGPYGSWRGSEMIHQAMSGTMFMTGHSGRKPLYGLGRRAYFACGTTACASVLAALHERDASRLGQVVRATVFESAAAIGQNLVSQYSYSKTYETRQRYPGFLALLKCRDQWMVLFAIRHWEELCQVFGLEHLLGDERFATQAGRLEHWPEVTDLLQERAGSRSAAELVDALQRARISAEVVALLADLVKSAQWEARRILRATGDRGDRVETALGPPFTVGSTEYVGARTSPRLLRGSDAERAANKVAAEWAQASAGNGPTAKVRDVARDVNRTPATDAGPLAGLRVIDFTTAWSGPFAARSLAYLGAQVIKIDAPSHMDSWRGALDGGRRDWYPDREPGIHPWNRCVLFNTQGQGKWSLGLDLKIAGARDVLLKLAQVSDVVIANFTPGVLERLGIGYDSLSELNPGVIVVEMPAFGPNGPDSGHQGMGKTMEAASGMAAHMGYGDGTPVLTGPAYLDPIGGLNAVAATLMALHYRNQTGRGCRVEVPQVEASLHWIGEHVLHQAEAVDAWVPDGNAVPYAAPHDAYPSAGEDEWIAIAVGDDDEWQSLCKQMDRLDLAELPKYSDLDGRKDHREELDAIISQWTSQFKKQELAASLQLVGVAAAPVANGADVAADEALLATHFIEQLSHREAGSHRYPTLSYLLTRTPGGVPRAAPCFGEQNDAVLRDVLSLPDALIGELRRSGAVADGPIMASPQGASAQEKRLDPPSSGGSDSTSVAAETT